MKAWSTRLLGLMDTLRPWKMTAHIPTAMAPQGETREGHYYTWLPGVISHFICRCGGNAGPREDVLGSERVHTKTDDRTQQRQLGGRLWDRKEDIVGRGACRDRGLGQGFGTTSTENGRWKQGQLRESRRGRPRTLGQEAWTQGSVAGGSRPTWCEFWLRPLLTD